MPNDRLDLSLAPIEPQEARGNHDRILCNRVALASEGAGGTTAGAWIEGVVRVTVMTAAVGGAVAATAIVAQEPLLTETAGMTATETASEAVANEGGEHF